MKTNLFEPLIHSKWQLVLISILTVTVLSVLASTPTFAATKTWSGAVDNTFNDAGNWTPAGIPVNGDDIIIVNNTGSTSSLINDISNLNVNSITLSGPDPVTINHSVGLILSGVYSSTTGNSSPSSYTGTITLGSDSTISDVDTSGSTLALAGHAITFTTTGGVTTTNTPTISGAGTVNIDVTNAVSIFLPNGNSYSGTTNLISGQATTFATSSNSIFGSSTINVSPTATISLNADGATWTFNNPINITQAVVGQSGFLTAQLFVWTDDNQTVNIPNITLNGNARFATDAILRTGATINLAGISADSYCVQYGDEYNSDATYFINGPSACVIGDDEPVVGVPDTAAKFATSNPIVVAALGLAVLAVAAVAIVRIRAKAN